MARKRDENIEPRAGEKFSFNVDIPVVAATFIHISQLILTRIQWSVELSHGQARN